MVGIGFVLAEMIGASMIALAWPITVAVSGLPTWVWRPNMWSFPGTGLSLLMRGRGIRFPEKVWGVRVCGALLALVGVLAENGVVQWESIWFLTMGAWVVDSCCEVFFSRWRASGVAKPPLPRVFSQGVALLGRGARRVESKVRRRKQSTGDSPRIRV